MRAQLTILLLTLTLGTAAHAQGIGPESYNIHHSDSCWYVTMNYRIAQMPKDDELILITQICCPDTCINDSTRRFQGKRYAKKYLKEYGHLPQLSHAGYNSFTMIIPEQMVTDTLIGVTYSEYTSPEGTIGALDTTEIILPRPATLSCHPLRNRPTQSDILAHRHPYIRNIAQYAVLDGSTAHIPTNLTGHVHFAMNSQHLDPNYKNNAATIDSLVAAISTLMGDKNAQVQSIQIVGYSSPDRADEIVPKLGYKRAVALRDHLQHSCNLPDSVFEVADGGKHWMRIYGNLAAQQSPKSDTLALRLLNEPNAKKRLATLRSYNGGQQYKKICSDSSHLHRGACCTRIYYHNLSDSSTHKLNSIVAELSRNPHPDYPSLLSRLKEFTGDARALNLIGIIEHRLHHRAAAAEAFKKAALMGDEQAAANMDILGLSMD